MSWGEGVTDTTTTLSENNILHETPSPDEAAD